MTEPRSDTDRSFEDATEWWCTIWWGTRGSGRNGAVVGRAGGSGRRSCGDMSGPEKTPRGGIDRRR